MSRLHSHALMPLVAVGLHALLAVPWWLHHALGKPAPKTGDTIEIPLDLGSERAPPKARRARRTMPAAEQAKAPSPVVASPKPAVARAAAPTQTAATNVDPEPSTKPSSPSAASAELPPILADARALDGDADSVLLLHTAAFRELSAGRFVAGRLRHGEALSAFFAASGLDPLRDVEGVLVTTSSLSPRETVVLQYNVPRFKVRGAEARLSLPPDRHFALPAPQILVLAAAGTEAAAARLPHDFRLSEPAGFEALELYVKAPPTAVRALVPDLPASHGGLELQLSLSADGSAELWWRSAAPGASSSGRRSLASSEVEAALATLLAALR